MFIVVVAAGALGLRDRKPVSVADTLKVKPLSSNDDDDDGDDEDDDGNDGDDDDNDDDAENFVETRILKVLVPALPFFYVIKNKS